MPDENQVTHPGDDNSAANPETTGTSNGTESGSANPPKTMPDEAYKGLQRKLQREQQERERLEAQLNDLKSQASNGGVSEQEMDGIVQGMAQILGQHDPDAAKQIAANYGLWKLQRQSQTAQQSIEQRQATEAAARQEAEAVSALREVAIDFDMDPDSPLLDYGSPSETFSARLSTLRQSIREAKRPVETSVTNTEPQRNVADGTAHNTQQGTVQAPRTTETVTKAMVDAARDAYIRTNTRENLAKWNDLRSKYSDSLLNKARN